MNKCHQVIMAKFGDSHQSIVAKFSIRHQKEKVVTILCYSTKLVNENRQQEILANIDLRHNTVQVEKNYHLRRYTMFEFPSIKKNGKGMIPQIINQKIQGTIHRVQRIRRYR